MFRLLAAAVLLGGLLGSARAQDEEPKKKKLSVGDPAPAVKADKWLHGTEVKAFEPGKVYIVEFWATWCGPCIVMMPHMAELQAEFRDKGVTIIGHTSKDPNNSEEKVVEFAKKRAAKLGYTFAYQDSRETYNAYMTAAGQNGIPCCYVVDKAGKIAFIGHPMYLDGVLPKVVDGTWDPVKGKEEVAKMEQVSNAAFGAFQGGPEAGLKKIAELEKENPWLAHVPYFTAPKMQALAQTKKFDEMKAMAEAVLAKAAKADDTAMLGNLAVMLTAPNVKDQKELTAVGVKAAGELVRATGGTDMRALMTARQVALNTGDTAAGKEYGAKALAVAEADAKKPAAGLQAFMAASQTAKAVGEAAKAKEYAGKAAGLAEAEAKKDEKNWRAQLTAAQVLLEAGDPAKAKGYAEKAVEGAPNENIKRQLRQILKPALGEEKKDGQ